ncbi:MAG: PilN domain-containing protein, partial [Curvibacter sp.]|nr:PilN domain-containing protein [Curvibacter sp.]
MLSNNRRPLLEHFNNAFLFMAKTFTELRLFGLDLNSLAADFVSPWRSLLRLPGLRWLTPVFPVLLWRADGREMLWQGQGVLQAMSFDATDVKAGRKPFFALELPPDLYLTRQLRLPAIPEADLSDAIDLEGRGFSPFPPTDLLMGHSVCPMEEGGWKVDLVLASRAQTQRYVDEQRSRFGARLGGATPEVWIFPGASRSALAEATQSMVVLTGFGEAARQRQIRFGQFLRVGLLSSALALALAMALSPLLQLRYRTLDAVDQLHVVQKRVAPLVHQRELLVQASDRVTALDALLQDRVEPLRILDALTKALPDDTYLATLSVHGQKVVFSGQTANAAALMQKLSNETLFHDVRAPSPALKTPGSNKETFSIELTLDLKALRAADANDTSSAAQPAGASTSLPTMPASPSTPATT